METAPEPRQSRTKRYRRQIGHLYAENATLESVTSGVMGLLEQATRPGLKEADRIRLRQLWANLRDNLADDEQDEAA